MRRGTTKAADYWALGVLIFEMLVGDPPFKSLSGDPWDTFRRTLSGRFYVPNFISESASSLICQLLQVRSCICIWHNMSKFLFLMFKLFLLFLLFLISVFAFSGLHQNDIKPAVAAQTAATRHVVSQKVCSLFNTIPFDLGQAVPCRSYALQDCCVRCMYTTPWS